MEWDSPLSMPMEAAYKDQAKQSLDKNAWEEKPEEKPRKTGKVGESGATTGVATTTVSPWQPPRAVVATTVRPWWLLPEVVAASSVRCVLAFFGALALGRGFCCSWGILGLFLLSYFDPHGPHFLAWIHLKHFSQKLGLDQRNLQ